MDFKEALKIAQEKEYLIGKIYKKAIIDEIIIYPSDPIQFNGYAKAYMLSKNAKAAIIPYMYNDVKVGAILDKNKTIKSGIFIYANIEDIEKHTNE